MADDSRASGDDKQKSYETDEDDQELTFEHGYGAQEGVLAEDESLEDVAGVSEKDVRDDLLEEANEAGEQGGKSN